MTTVNADRTKLPERWQRDPEYAARVWRDVDVMLREGLTAVEVAQRIGVSNRSIGRHLERARRRAEALNVIELAMRRRASDWGYLDADALDEVRSALRHYDARARIRP